MSHLEGQEALIRPISKETGLMIIFDNPTAVPAPAGQYSHLARLDLGYKTMLQLSGRDSANHHHRGGITVVVSWRAH
jgi:hypothetical protein